MSKINITYEKQQKAIQLFPISLKSSKVNTIIEEREKLDLTSLLIKNPGKEIEIDK